MMALVLTVAPSRSGADELPHIIERIKPSVVGIGNFQKVRSPTVTFLGSGFVVGDGNSVITAAHVVDDAPNTDPGDMLGILIGMGERAQFRAAKISAIDSDHDLALLRVVGAPLPAMPLGDSDQISEGRALAFTGFPLGMVLGLHHVTHRGMVSSITPVGAPASAIRKSDSKPAAPSQKPTYPVFQLDGSAYPGSSGSPVFDPDTGVVYGVINMVYLPGSQDGALNKPSGITYAIPANYIRALLHEK